MKRVCTLILANVMLLTLTACGGSADSRPLQNETSAQSGTPQTEIASSAVSVPDNDSSGTDESTEHTKILITYFSRTGNTKTIAEYILSLTWGELFEIKTIEPYPEDYNACLSQASEELAADYRPALSTHVSDMNDYNVIFIGYPIWHGNTPMAIRSFLEEYDFSGKTVIPFCTSGSSGISQSVSAIRNICPDSDVLDGLCIDNSSFNNSYELVEEWIRGLNIKGDHPSIETDTDKNKVESDAEANAGIAPQPDPVPQPEPESEANENEKISVMPNINITVGGSVFLAKLYDNSAARAFLAQFPLTLNMSDMNSNEKYYYLAEDLPSESTERPATINTGDLMCWSGNCLVLFYKSFSNSYGGYVRLGHVEDASGLASALGNGNVEIAFDVSD